MRILSILIFLSSQQAIGQMTAKDSMLVETKALHPYYNCLHDRMAYQEYSNGQMVQQDFYLKKRDSIVTYYFNGNVATMSLLYGCRIDTMSYTSREEWTPEMDMIVYDTESTSDSIYQSETWTKWLIDSDSSRYRMVTSNRITHAPRSILTYYSPTGEVLEIIDRSSR